MSNLLTKGKYKLFSSLLTLGVAALTKKSIDKGYRATTGDAPPKNPEAENASMRNVILYAAVTAAATVTAQILVRKFLTHQWEKENGELPESLE